MDGETLKRVPLRDNLLGQGLILTTLALMALGVVMVFSTAGAVRSHVPWYDQREVRQAIFAVAGFLLLCVLWRMDYRWLIRRPWAHRPRLRRLPSPAGILLIAAVIAAVAVLALGEATRGTLRFIRFGPLGFQPSEVLKFAVLIALAALLGRPGAEPRSFKRTFAPAVGLVALAIGLVVTEDFGTAAIIGIGAAALMLMGQVPWHYLLGLVPLVAGGFYGFVVCDPRRWGRIAAMVDPFSSTNPSAYQPLQSMIAIASGADPAGPGGGVAKYGYLPESSTDFVFSMICQELGILGAAVVIGLWVVWLVLAWRAARRAPGRFGALLGGGLGFLVGLQATMHIAVTVVWMPPTGVSLPFVSAGGSSLLATAAATALIVSVSSRRPAGPRWRAASS